MTTLKSLAIHQPNLFPRLKVLQKITHADSWVILDDVQFVGREWQNRARLRYAGDPGREFWLTLPARRPRGRSTLISQVEVVDHKRTLERLRRGVTYTYRASPHWGDIVAVLDQLPPSPDLSSLAVASANALLTAAGVEVPTMKSSALDVPGRRVDKLIGICKSLGATHYVSGSGGATYAEVDEFRRAGIDVRSQEWTPPATRPQLSWRDISALDLLARHGADALQTHLRAWR